MHRRGRAIDLLSTHEAYCSASIRVGRLEVERSDVALRAREAEVAELEDTVVGDENIVLGI